MSACAHALVSTGAQPHSLALIRGMFTRDRNVVYDDEHYPGQARWRVPRHTGSDLE